MAKVSNYRVIDLAESIFRSGYPMRPTAPTEEEFVNETHDVANEIMVNIATGNDVWTNPHILRAIKLANAKGGGHDQFLTGVTVSFDLTFSNKAWVEAERYTFLNFVSSMSTMHRLTQMNVGQCCNSFVSEEELRRVEQLQADFILASEDKKNEAYLKLLYNVPAGFELTAGMVTNYRCLKNIYAQRRHHKLPDWHVMCKWIETLPMAKELIVGTEK